MKTILIVIFCVIVVPAAHSQITFKVYQNTDFSVNPQCAYSDEVTSTVHFSRFSSAVQFREKKKYFHEIEISYAQKAIPIVHSEPASGPYDSEKDYVGIQYEINRPITHPDNRLRFSVGAGTLLYYFL